MILWLLSNIIQDLWKLSESVRIHWEIRCHQTGSQRGLRGGMVRATGRSPGAFAKLTTAEGQGERQLSDGSLGAGGAWMDGAWKT